MNHKIITISLVLISVSLIGCASKRNKQLDAYYQLLSQTATAKISPTEKLDVLAETVVKVMDEGVNVLNPNNGAKYVERFGEQNEDNIFAILDEVGEWQKGLSTAEKLGFGLNMLQKPYVNDLIDLVPKFQKKYKQIEFVSRFSKRMRREISDFGLGKLTE